MKKQIYDKSVQNARIDLNIKTGKAKFGFPTKKKGKLWEICLIGSLISIPYLLLIGGILTILTIVMTDWTDVLIQSEMNEIRINLIEYFEVALRFIFALVLSPFIIASYPVLVNRNLLKKIPKLQLFVEKWLLYKRCYVARFENIKTKKVSIPLFKNTILKYEASGDFAKQLNNIKIKEHPFMDVMRRGDRVIVRPNEYLWEAIVTFNKIPKDGKIDLFFM